jgi:hypothetical protein
MAIKNVNTLENDKRLRKGKYAFRANKRKYGKFVIEK